MQTRFGNYNVRAVFVKHLRIQLINGTHAEFKPGDTYDVDGIYTGLCNATCYALHRVCTSPFIVDRPDHFKLEINMPLNLADPNGEWAWQEYDGR